MSYAELLKDPRWQKKRLEIMERDEWACKMCEDTEATLTVHHKSYRMVGGKFVDIWDYPGDDLVTLCENCHGEEEANLDKLKKSVFFSMRDICNDADSIGYLLGFFYTIRDTYGRRLDGDFIKDMSSQIDKYTKERYHPLRVWMEERMEGKK